MNFDFRLQEYISHDIFLTKKQSSGGVLQKKVFLKMSQSSEESTCTGKPASLFKEIPV